jgi:hypothetical protein
MCRHSGGVENGTTDEHIGGLGYQVRAGGWMAKNTTRFILCKN